MVSLVAIAVTIYAGTLMGTGRILATTERVYEELRLFDLEVRIGPIPDGVLPSPATLVSEVPGVSAATYRLLVTGTVETTGDRVAGALITAVAPSSRPDVSDVRILRGSFLTPGRPLDVVVDATFAEDMGLAVGDAITLRASGRERRVRVAGIAVFPEFLVSSVDDNFSIPVRRTAAAFLISNELVADAAGVATGAYNSIAVKIARGSARERVLAGVRSFVERHDVAVVASNWPEDQYSVRCNRVRIATFRDFLPTATAVLDGLAFLALMMLVVRTTRLYRREIGTLLAVGIPRRTILSQWLIAVGTMVAAGAVAGTAGAFVIAARLTRQYMEVTGFPILLPGSDAVPLAGAFAMSMLLVPLGAIAPLARVLSRPPASLLAQGAEVHGVPWVLRAARWIDAAFDGLPWLRYPERLGVRNVARRPIAFLTSTLCIAGMLVMASSMYVFADGMDESLSLYLSGQRWNYLVEFASPESEADAGKLLTGAGATAWEGLWIADAALRHQGRERSVKLLAGQVSPSLREDRVIVRGRPIERADAPEIVVDLRTARSLAADVGDRLEVVGEGQTLDLRIVGVTSNFSVNQAFVSVPTLTALAGRPLPPQGAVLAGPPDLGLRLSRMTEIARLLPGDVLADASRKNLSVTANFCRLYGDLGVLVGAVLVLVFLGMNIEDRTAEYALLRSHGFTPPELLRSLLVEGAIIGATAIAVSYPLTRLATHVFQLRIMAISDFYPLRMGFGAWVELMAPAFLFMLLGVAPALRKIMKISVVESLRSRITG
ncbi:MAG TPA: ABC transporter permease [Kofleriaceae bacterium]|nr:ABC transporter permease [Kofleriaceae bacterium]